MLNIIAITGPTGVGKTALSVALAKKYNAEIINSDAVQVYKGLDIGSAKITTKEMDGVKHHLLSFVDLNNDYTVFDYQRDGRKVIDDIRKREKNIIVVGGTGLYLKALLYNYEFNTEEKHNYDELSNEELTKLIKKYDETIDIDFSNRRRLESTYNKIENGTYTKIKSNKLLYKTTFIGLTTSRDNLYNIINSRVDKMIQLGLIEETTSLYKTYPTSKVLNSAIGYKELINYLNNKCPKEDAIDLIKKNSRHYAKRQYTFFNHQLPITWFNTNYNDFNSTINEVISFIDKNKEES